MLPWNGLTWFERFAIFVEWNSWDIATGNYRGASVETGSALKQPVKLSVKLCSFSFLRGKSQEKAVGAEGKS
jgi:hypothetical protein